MGDIRSGMPVLCKHLGEWKGEYVYVDPAGKVLDRHASHLSCELPATGPYQYYQINRYLWDDGRKEEIHFPATYRDGRIWWDTERITGWASDVALDGNGRTTMLYWVRKDMADAYLYEMIQINDAGDKRSRTWHWFKGGVLFQRTIISETRFK